MEFKKARSEPALLLKYLRKTDKILDVGCGEGALVKYLLGLKYDVYGADRKNVIAKSLLRFENRMLGKRLHIGKAEKLPYSDLVFDSVVFFASFHHIPFINMRDALSECRRVIKPGGRVVIIEPLPVRGHYYELLKLAEDEKRIQERTYRFLKRECTRFFGGFTERFYYIKRTPEDFRTLLERYVAGIRKRKSIWVKAEKLINKNKHPDLFKSTVRLILLSA